MVQFCTNCGETLNPGTKFCPRCGKVVEAPAPDPIPSNASSSPIVQHSREVAPPPVIPPPPVSYPTTHIGEPATSRPVVTSDPATGSRKGLLIAVPIVILLLGIGVWALLAGLPFGGDKKLTRTQQPEPSIINEQEGGNTTTISEIRVNDEPVRTPPRAMPPVAVPPRSPVLTQTAPPPLRQPAETATRPPVVFETRPVPAVTPPRTETREATGGREISEDEAVNVLRGYITSRDYYGIATNCVGMASAGYENVGYTIDVVDRCGDRGRLGRWRVDAKTREVFRQRGDGRYLRP